MHGLDKNNTPHLFQAMTLEKAERVCAALNRLDRPSMFLRRIRKSLRNILCVNRVEHLDESDIALEKSILKLQNSK
jgi:hypothetical protein